MFWLTAWQVSSALRNSEQRAPGCGRHRTRCYSEVDKFTIEYKFAMSILWLQVTSTPYSSHENLNCSDADMPDLSPAEVKTEFTSSFNSTNLQAPLGPPMPCSSSPAATAEAPELSYGEVWIIVVCDDWWWQCWEQWWSPWWCRLRTYRLEWACNVAIPPPRCRSLLSLSTTAAWSCDSDCKPTNQNRFKLISESVPFNLKLSTMAAWSNGQLVDSAFDM